MIPRFNIYTKFVWNLYFKKSYMKYFHLNKPMKVGLSGGLVGLGALAV